MNFSTARGFGNGTVFITWSQPATATLLQGNGFSHVGEPATFTARLFPVNPVAGEPAATGTVELLRRRQAARQPAGDSPMHAVTLTTSSLTPGLHTITASYNGDAVYAGSTSDPLTQEVAAPYVFTSTAALSGVVGVPLSFTVSTTGFPPPAAAGHRATSTA